MLEHGPGPLSHGLGRLASKLSWRAAHEAATILALAGPKQLSLPAKQGRRQRGGKSILVGWQGERGWLAKKERRRWPGGWRGWRAFSGGDSDGDGNARRGAGAD
ncbi:hypothetical protein NL676_034863 [Syzygium grande]|nr:hypothetical protein NL676_034863 [Syzygium grande]